MCSTRRWPSIWPRSSMPPPPSRPSRTAGMASPTRPERTSNSLPMSPASASSDSSFEPGPTGPVPSGSALRARATRRATDTLDSWRSDGAARWLFIWPTVLLILILSIFPLVASIALSLSRLAFHQGGVDLKFIGFTNYQQLLFGLERSHFLGVLKSPSPLGWAIVIATVGLSAYAWVRAARSGRVRPIGLVLRLIGGALLVGFVWIAVQALVSEGGRPGALIVTLIFVLAALGSLDKEVREAALVDGAGRWQSFRHITMPAILPVTTTIVLIRLIEGFKIIDMPNILLGGGPGTATQSMTLQAYIDWNTLNLGRSAAIAYLLLILVSVVATVYVGFVRRRVTDLA